MFLFWRPPDAASYEKVVNMTTYWYQFMMFSKFPQNIPLFVRKLWIETGTMI